MFAGLKSGHCSTMISMMLKWSLHKRADCNANFSADQACKGSFDALEDNISYYLRDAESMQIPLQISYSGLMPHLGMLAFIFFFQSLGKISTNESKSQLYRDARNSHLSILWAMQRFSLLLRRTDHKAACKKPYRLLCYLEL